MVAIDFFISIFFLLYAEKKTSDKNVITLNKSNSSGFKCLSLPLNPTGHKIKSLF